MVDYDIVIGGSSPEKKIASLGGQGILRVSDLEDLRDSVRRVFELMSDGQWHRAKAIKIAAGGGTEQSEGLRRMRELRDNGLVVEKRHVKGTRAHEYKLTQA